MRATNANEVFVFFLVGTKSNEYQMKKGKGWSLEREIRNFGDILQVNIQESYLNNTLKVLSLYSWLQEKCPKTKFVLKVDDDIYMNYKVLLQEISVFASNPRYQYAQIGIKDRSPGVQHNKSAKQYLLQEIFPLQRFGFDYVYGFAALTPMKLMNDVLDVALCLRGIFVDDVYLNGFLPHILGAPVIHWPSLNVQITQSRPFRISWKYISQYSITPELSAMEIFYIHEEEIASELSIDE